MKRLAVMFGVAVAVTALAAAAFAFDLPSKAPSSGKELMDTGGKAAVETAMNKKIEKYNCAFKGNTPETTCDLKKLGNELAAVSKGSKEVGNYNVWVKIEAGPGEVTGKAKKKAEKMDANDRANAVRDQLKSGLGNFADTWRYNTSSTKEPNKLAISVKVE
ncbi:MAG: hypothetical protein WC956_08645 [bacterium]